MGIKMNEMDSLEMADMAIDREQDANDVFSDDDTRVEGGGPMSDPGDVVEDFDSGGMGVANEMEMTGMEFKNLFEE